ncbi:MAG: hypothetical protein K0Q99_93, partial [Clostridia bacterium]|nr:hypothetical protein [Clostridia bacterium]
NSIEDCDAQLQKLRDAVMHMINE